MLFNSFEFLLFYIAVVAAYFALPQRFRWVLLLGASYYFYMSWRAEYVVLLIACTLINFGVGIGLERASRSAQRTALLAIGIASSLALLFTYKYLDFFTGSVNSALVVFGSSLELTQFGLLLPLGISFYTFQAIGYTIDVYRRSVPAEKHLGIFALYVSFFPQLVAGPIERSGHLLPQFRRVMQFDPARVTEGLRLVLWGLIKKVVIADQLAVVVDTVYSDPNTYSGPFLILATAFFAVQIYCDFSGYSDIAVGTARVLNYDLMTNFRRPYLASSIADFWRRWHISLSSWFRDYLYIPLGGSRVSWGFWVRNILVVFLVSGVWHGANWTFVVWGAIHGVCFIVGAATEKSRRALAERVRLSGVPRLHGALRIAGVWLIVLLAWVFFRAQSVGDAVGIITRFGDWDQASFATLWLLGLPRFEMVISIASIAMLFLVEACQEFRAPWVERLWARRPVRWACYATEFYAIVFFGVFGHVEFIYFQF